MTPIEKSEELVDSFREHFDYCDCRNNEPLEVNHAKQCALICVDEILGTVTSDSRYKYYKEVKQEIEKL